MLTSTTCYVIGLIIGVALAIIMLSFNVCRWAYNEVSFRMQLRRTVRNYQRMGVKRL